MKKDSLFHCIKELEKTILKSMGSGKEKKEIPTPTQMRIVDYILNNIEKEEIYQKEIEDALNLSKATISDVLNRMERKGLIERDVTLQDTRRKTIRLSKKAREVFERNQEKLEQLEKKAEENISEEELTLFFHTIEKMIENLKQEKKG